MPCLAVGLEERLHPPMDQLSWDLDKLLTDDQLWIGRYSQEGATVNPRWQKVPPGVTQFADRGLRLDISPITGTISPTAVRLHSNQDDDITKTSFPAPAAVNTTGSQ